VPGAGAAYRTRMLIAEELLLIGLDPVRGSLPMGTSGYVEVGLSGALLAELVLLGAVTLRDGDVVAVDGPAPADPMLAEAQALVAGAPEPVTAADAVQRLGEALQGGVRERLSMRLVEAGALAVDEGGLLSSTRFPVADSAVHEEIISSARAAARGEGPLTGRQAILLSLAGPCRLLERVAPERSDHPRAKARIAEASAAAPFAPEVEKIIDRLITAAYGC
jgi:hypothetical protein